MASGVLGLQACSTMSNSTLGSYLHFLSFKLLSIILYLWVFCLYICLCATCEPGARGIQKVLGPLELEVQMSDRGLLYGCWN